MELYARIWEAYDECVRWCVRANEICREMGGRWIEGMKRRWIGGGIGRLLFSLAVGFGVEGECLRDLNMVL